MSPGLRPFSFSIALTVLLVPGAASRGAAAGNVIRVAPDQVIGPFNRWLLGSNQLSYDVDYKHTGKIQTGYTCYGAGIWDPQARRPVPELVELAKEIGISVARFPGGCGTHDFDWKKTVGPVEQRPQWQFGIPEFMRWVEAVGCKVVWTVSYFTGTEKDAADLVEYLNAPVGANPNGGKDWAAVRAADGHPAPYGITYFEFGNEVYHGNHNDIARVEPADYAQRFLKYARAMKAVDPKIKLGMILGNEPWTAPREQHWDTTILPVIKNDVDFLIDHHYPPFGRQHAGDDWNGLVSATLAAPELIKEKLAAVKQYSRKVVGRELPVAITEFNAGYAGIENPPMRHSLGAALVNAELLQTYSQPDTDVVMANYWQFANSYWGQVKGTDSFKGGGPYLRRPNFYPFWMYAQHFGPQLVRSEFTGAKVDNPAVGAIPPHRGDGQAETRGKQNLLDGAVWNIDPAPGVEAEVKDGVISVDFRRRQDLNYFHVSAEAAAAPNHWYEVTADVRTENLDTKNGITLALQDARGYNVTKSQVAGNVVTGTTDWTPVTVRYHTLPDTKAVDVIVRRWGGVAGKSDAISGKAFFRNISLHDYSPEYLPGLPALVTNASRSADGRTVYLIVVNRDLENAQPTTLDLGPFRPESGRAWVLTGSSVTANNEHDSTSVQLHEEPVTMTTPFTFTFASRSVTALELTRR